MNEKKNNNLNADGKKAEKNNNEFHCKHVKMLLCVLCCKYLVTQNMNQKNWVNVEKKIMV